MSIHRLCAYGTHIQILFLLFCLSLSLWILLCRSLSFLIRRRFSTSPTPLMCGTTTISTIQEAKIAPPFISLSQSTASHFISEPQGTTTIEPEEDSRINHIYMVEWIHRSYEGGRLWCTSNKHVAELASKQNTDTGTWTKWLSTPIEMVYIFCISRPRQPVQSTYRLAVMGVFNRTMASTTPHQSTNMRL